MAGLGRLYDENELWILYDPPTGSARHIAKGAGKPMDNQSLEDAAAFLAELAEDLGGDDAAANARQKLHEVMAHWRVLDQVDPSPTSLAMARILAAACLAERMGTDEMKEFGDFAANLLVRTDDVLVVDGRRYTRAEYASAFHSSGRATATGVIAGGDLRLTPEADLASLAVAAGECIQNGTKADQMVDTLLESLHLEFRSPLRASLIRKHGWYFHRAVRDSLRPVVEEALSAEGSDASLVAREVYSALQD